MATIKSYTDISQSKILAEILPLESADMRYGHIAPYEFSGRMYDGGYDKVPYPKDFLKLCADFCEEDIYDGSLPCWSLARLLNILPEYNLQRTDWGNKTEYKIVVTVNEDNYASKNYDDPLDACYEMVICLKELNLL